MGILLAGKLTGNKEDLITSSRIQKSETLLLIYIYHPCLTKTQCLFNPISIIYPRRIRVIYTKIHSLPGHTTVLKSN